MLSVYIHRHCIQRQMVLLTTICMYIIYIILNAIFCINEWLYQCPEEVYGNFILTSKTVLEFYLLCHR